MATGFEYTSSSYSTSSSPTPYPSQYRTAIAYSASSPTTPTYVSTPTESPTQYMYSTSYEHHSPPHQPSNQSDMSVIDPSFILPLPSITSGASSTRVPGVMRTGGMYEAESSTSNVGPYFLTGSTYGKLAYDSLHFIVHILTPFSRFDSRSILLHGNFKQLL